MDGLMQLLDSRFWPSWAALLWARTAILLGAIFVINAAVMAVRHYCFGRPIAVINTRTHRPMTRVGLLTWVLCTGGGGALFLVLGILKYP